MNKPHFAVFFPAFLLPACALSLPAKNTAASTEHALIVSITSRGNGIDRVAYNEVQRLINEAVVNGVLDKAIVYKHGKEGGFSACIQAKQTTDINAFSDLAMHLKMVSVDNHTTAYALTPTTQCSTHQ